MEAITTKITRKRALKLNFGLKTNDKFCGIKIMLYFCGSKYSIVRISSGRFGRRLLLLHWPPFLDGTFSLSNHSARSLWVYAFKETRLNWHNPFATVSSWGTSSFFGVCCSLHCFYVSVCSSLRRDFGDSQHTQWLIQWFNLWTKS